MLQMTPRQFVVDDLLITVAAEIAAFTLTVGGD
jgi:hypothetical protein